MEKIKSITRKLFHSHNQGINNFDFLLRCDCGHSKLTKLPMTIVEVLLIESKKIA